MNCSISNCPNKILRQNKNHFCQTHQYRFKKGIDLTLPIKYLKHGLVKTPAYRTWAMMKNRTTNPKAMDWKYYGGRGITLCKRWHSFRNFLEDMGERPPHLTLDRINNNRGYSLSNCRWATKREQRANQRLR